MSGVIKRWEILKIIKKCELQVRMTVKKRWLLYEIISENPGLTIDGLCKKVKWNRRKISRYANKLAKDKMVLQPKYFPTPLKDLINWNEMKHTKKPID